MHLYAIKDNIAGRIYGSVLTYHHPAQAVRAFGDLCNDKSGYIQAHIKDFDLYVLGAIDLETLQITPQVAEVISGAAWLMAQQPQETQNAEG